MATISVCMIVKNEEKVLSRCLDSLKGLYEELIIVDTGSSDNTKKIAARYTDKIYDFEWIKDFSAARNFANSKATKEYIYSADADEVLSPENYEKFKFLKENLEPGIDIVQMKYGNQLDKGTVYNFDEELRPKLFRRLREFVWIEQIHETLRLDPVVFDSDIVITHKPESNHSRRDIDIFAGMIKEGKTLSKRLLNMYARELYINGTADEFAKAKDYFLAVSENPECSKEEFEAACCVLAKGARINDDYITFLKYTSKILAGDGLSEICVELGAFYEDAKDLEEACVWYYNAAYETEPTLVLKTARELPLKGLIRCYKQLGNETQAKAYEEELKNL